MNKTINKRISKALSIMMALLMILGGLTIPGTFFSPSVSAASATATLVNKSSISSTSITKGDSVTLYASATGGSGNYTYAYYYKKCVASSWMTASDFSTATSAKITPLVATDYDARVSVKDSTGKVVSKDFKISVAKAQTSEELTNNSTISSTMISKGNSFTLYGAASGGSGKYTYAYYYKKSVSSDWMTASKFSTATSAKITPAVATDYDARVSVKDSSTGKVVSKDFKVTVTKALTSKSSISTTSITKGQSLKLYGSAAGGSGDYQYAYYYKLSKNSVFKTIQDYSTTQTITYKPTTANDYDFMIKVKDSGGNTVKSTFTVHVAAALSCNAAVSAETVAVNGKVLISGAASGGSEGYTYAYYYKESSDSSYTTIKTYSTTTSINLTFRYSGTYKILVRVKDSNGAVASKTFNVSVTAAEGLDATVDAILNEIIDNSMTDLEKIRAIHDWLVNNVEYDTTGYNSGNIADTSYTAEGLFATRVAVCDGYAKAFTAMASRAGFDVIHVTGLGYNGTVTESHAWNQIKWNGKWYNVDVTWDDPVVSAGYGDNLSYEYFMVPDSVFELDHSASSTKYSCTAEQPTDLLIPYIIEEATSAPNTVYCENTTDLAAAFGKYKNNSTSVFTIIYKSSGTSSDVFDDIRRSYPAGYSLSISLKPWKFSGYYEVGITLTKV